MKLTFPFLSYCFFNHPMKTGHAAKACRREFKKQVYPKLLIPITFPKKRKHAIKYFCPDKLFEIKYI